jgi:uncharacterized protein YkwD
VAFFLLLFHWSSAQEQFHEEELNQVLKEQINLLRGKAKLPLLEADEILDAVAFDQASFIADQGKVTHEQDQQKKKTLMDRMLYYEGLYAAAGENAAIIGVGSKAEVEEKGPRVTISTEEEAVKAAIVSWLDEEEGRLNLLDPDFYRIGSAVLIDEQQEITLVAVIAALPYQNPGKDKLPLNLYGVEAYNKESCARFLEEHPSLPQLFSDALKVEGNEVFFEYHSLSFVEEVLNDASDGIAVDVITDGQFSCKEGNRLFPGGICKGYLLPPLKKMKLSAYNQLKESGGVKVSMGRLPDFYQKENCELNAVIIQDGHHCETVPFNRVDVKNTNWFETAYLLAGKTDTNIYRWSDTSRFSTPWRDVALLKEELKEQLAFLEAIHHTQEYIQAELHLSPAEEQEVALQKLEAVLEELELLDKVEVIPTIDWKGFNERKKGTFYQLETQGMDSLQVADYLKIQVVKDEDLRTLLSPLNKVHWGIRGEAFLSKEGKDTDKLKLLKKYMRTVGLNPQQMEAALFLQLDVLEGIANGRIQREDLPGFDPSQKKETLPLISNLIIINEQLGDKTFDGNPIHLAFLELYLIDARQKEISFNKHLSQLKHWSKHFEALKDPEKWLSSYRSLAAKVPGKQYARGMLNYYMLAADYFYEKEDFAKRKKAFDAIIDWQGKSRLSDEELLNLAKYLCYQDQFPMAIALLRKEISKKKAGKELFRYFLQIAIYDREQVPHEKYAAYMQDFQESYPEEFCSLFSKESLGLQQLENFAIKQLYCEECEE